MKKAFFFHVANENYKTIAPGEKEKCDCRIFYCANIMSRIIILLLLAYLGTQGSQLSIN